MKLFHLYSLLREAAGVEFWSMEAVRTQPMDQILKIKDMVESDTAQEAAVVEIILQMHLVETEHKALCI